MPPDRCATSPTHFSTPASKTSLTIEEMQRLPLLSRTILALLVAGVIMINGCAKQSVQQTMARNFQATTSSPKVLAVYMPWFGNGTHVDVGYSSADPAVQKRQIEQAKGMGISTFLVDWYGDRHPFLDQNFASLQRTAHEHNFQVALLLNEPDDYDGQATDAAIQAFEKAEKQYFGPNAPYHDAYLTYDGRPVVFIFPKQGHSDWNRIREYLNRLPSPPVLFYKDDAPAPQYANAFDGYFAWVHPGEKWSVDGSDWGKQYLDTFYRRMKNRYPDKLVAAAAWPGFDDSRAQWGLNRHMNGRCGQTFADTLHSFRDQQNSLKIPFLLIETWNDYEEGTAIERRNLDDCRKTLF